MFDVHTPMHLFRHIGSIQMKYSLSGDRGGPKDLVLELSQ
jgi:hypothetical protein